MVPRSFIFIPLPKSACQASTFFVIDNELECPSNKRQGLFVFKPLAGPPLMPHLCVTALCLFQYLMAVWQYWFSDVEVHHQEAHIKLSHPVLFPILTPICCTALLAKCETGGLLFLAPSPANLYANVKIIINEVHAWLAPINTTLRQQTIHMATFHTARQLGGVLMWWGRP